MGNLPPVIFHAQGHEAKHCLRVLPALTNNPQPGGVFLALPSLAWPVGWVGPWALLPVVIQGPSLLPSCGSSALLVVLEVLGKGARVGDLMAQSGVTPIPLARAQSLSHTSCKGVWEVWSGTVRGQGRWGAA